MRNVFENLQYEQEVQGDSKTELTEFIYTNLYKVFNHKKIEINSSDFINIIDCGFSGISAHLSSEYYYVLHDLTLQKSKKIIKIGRLVIASKSALLKFFKEECCNHEETLFFIMPKDSSETYILSNTEDWDFRKTKINANQTIKISNK